MSSEQEAREIPSDMRLEALERDGRSCRVCGRSTELVLHHIKYGGDAVGMGGRRKHALDNIVTLGGGFSHTCHQLVHSNKGLWVPLMQEVIATPGVTAFELKRWASGR